LSGESTDRAKGDGKVDMDGGTDDYEAEFDLNAPLPPRYDAEATEEEREAERKMFRKWQTEAQRKHEGLGGGPGLLRDPTYVRD